MWLISFVSPFGLAALSPNLTLARCLGGVSRVGRGLCGWVVKSQRKDLASGGSPNASVRDAKQRLCGTCQSDHLALLQAQSVAGSQISRKHPSHDVVFSPEKTITL